MLKAECAIIGGGTVGLGVAPALLRKQPGLKLVLLEKEKELASHQSGRNSGVIHAGIYYKPGSLKARLAREDNRSMVTFCRESGIQHEVCGKVIVATNEMDLPALENLHRRGWENELEVVPLKREQVKESEPHVQCLKGLRVPATGIVSFRSVCEKLAEMIREAGGVIKTETVMRGIRFLHGTYLLETPSGEIEAKFLINCGGLQSDRMARRAGIELAAKIVPFRGEYYELKSEKRNLVKALIFPVPDPAFPLLGVHFTRMIDGSVHAGPNAVLAFKREGYRRTDWRLTDLWETLTYPGFWTIVRRHYRKGAKEMWRSMSKAAFTKSLQRLIPEMKESYLVEAPAGVRAQVLLPDGRLMDDFLIKAGPSSIHVCNAPSPAATASIEIGKMVADMVPELKSAMKGTSPGLSVVSAGREK
ncbi:MAG: L-2-hydroxyglutarate oxidase [Spartobacteria bacterium]